MAKIKKETKTVSRKELFATLTEEQQADFMMIVGKVALKETNRHYLTRKEIDLRKDMTGAQCAMLDKIIKTILTMDENTEE